LLPHPAWLKTARLWRQQPPLVEQIAQLALLPVQLLQLKAQLLLVVVFGGGIAQAL